MGLLAWLFLMINGESACAFDFTDISAIGAAYMTHLSLHEIGHQVVAEEVGADSPKISFFTKKDGRLYPGLSTYKDIPKESKLPYAAGGDRMAGFTFEYALKSYRYNPTTYNKALMFFSCADFFLYTLLANYVRPENDMYDPNLIREETGLSKGVLLSLITAKTLINTYRVFNESATVTPMIVVDRKSASLIFCFRF